MLILVYYNYQVLNTLYSGRIAELIKNAREKRGDIDEKDEDKKIVIQAEF